jgi:type II secretory pathway pseudopilin PulG
MVLIVAAVIVALVVILLLAIGSAMQSGQGRHAASSQAEIARQEQQEAQRVSRAINDLYGQAEAEVRRYARDSQSRRIT